MGNRLDNMTSAERDEVYNYLRSSYYINRTGSVDDVRDALKFIVVNESNKDRIEDSINDELAGHNRKSVIDLLNSKLKKISGNGH